MKHLCFSRVLPLVAALSAIVLLAAKTARAELPPTLEPLAKKFDADRAVLTTAGEAQIKPAHEKYLAALNAAQQAATAAAKTAEIAAIASEMGSVEAGALPENFPPDLPRTLAGDRRACVNAEASVWQTILPRQRDLATKYLQALAGLGATAARTGDAALTTAVAQEKQRVFALSESAGGGQKNRNVVANGDFSQGQAGEMPPGWQSEASDVTVTDATVTLEGADRFVRFRRLQAIRRANLSPEKEFVVPNNSQTVEFGARMRVKGLVPGKDWGIYPGMRVSARDARGEEISGEATQAKQDTSWKRFTAKLNLPATAKTIRVQIGPQGAAGVIDFDDVVVEFR
jgi:hypothetical protein